MNVGDTFGGASATLFYQVPAVAFGNFSDLFTYTASIGVGPGTTSTAVMPRCK